MKNLKVGDILHSLTTPWRYCVVRFVVSCSRDPYSAAADYIRADVWDTVVCAWANVNVPLSSLRWEHAEDPPDACVSRAMQLALADA